MEGVNTFPRCSVNSFPLTGIQIHPQITFLGIQVDMAGEALPGKCFEAENRGTAVTLDLKGKQRGHGDSKASPTTRVGSETTREAPALALTASDAAAHHCS